MKNILLEKRLTIGKILDICRECNKAPQKSSGKATFDDINYCKSECNLWNEMQECRASIEEIQKEKRKSIPKIADID
jgi:uncharacterized protein YgiB involved in biofilm formation